MKFRLLGTLLLVGGFSILQAQKTPPSLILKACPVVGSNEAALPVIRDLTPSDQPVQVSVEFTEVFVDEKVDSWTREEQDNVCKAALYMQRVWSSKEFKTAVEGKWWILSRNPRTLHITKVWIAGPDLYKDLMGDQHKVAMRVSVSSNTRLVPNNALSDSTGWTVLQASYAKGTGDLVCLKNNTLVSCLTNTLSHEYTHYWEAVESTDGTSSAIDNDDYVSYGIGDLTQSLAFPK